VSRRETLQAVVRGLPMGLALSMVAAVWVAGAVWSFDEQRAFAASLGFLLPALLPLTIDGLALALASVAWAASLDGRAAMQARLGTAVAIASSSGSNARWAWERTSGDVSALLLAAGVPVGSFLAFEVLLAELRRQVHRRRGLPAPVAVPYPRLVRLALAPSLAFREWRAMVLDLTAPQAGPDVRGSYIDSADVEQSTAEAVSAAPGDDGLAVRPRVAAARTGPRKTTAKAKEPDLSEADLATGREVAEGLVTADQAVTVRALVAGFRDRGQSLSSDRAAALARALRA
jgi:hypothetical protein